MSSHIRAAARKVLPVGVRRLVYNAVLSRGLGAPLDRRFIANKYLKGEGIEIGALHLPLKVPRAARVKYVDRMTTAELKTHYPEMEGVALVEPDIIDDGQKLEKVADGSQDFVIANHFVEHVPDPLGTVANMFRVLGKGGVLFMALPDKRFTFDVDRPVTPLAHIIRDHEQGPDWSRRGHFEEWSRLVDKKEGAEAERHALELMEKDYSIHFHVWTPVEMLEMVLYLKAKMGLDFEVELFHRNQDEGVFVLRKS